MARRPTEYATESVGLVVSTKLLIRGYQLNLQIEALMAILPITSKFWKILERSEEALVKRPGDPYGRYGDYPQEEHTQHIEKSLSRSFGEEFFCGQPPRHSQNKTKHSSL